MSGLWLISYVALWILFLVMALLLIGLLHLVGEIYKAMSLEPPVTSLKKDEEAPEIVLQDLKGKRATTEQFRGRITAFVIVSEGCSHCHKLLEEMANAKKELSKSSMPQVVLLSLDGLTKTKQLINQFELTGIFVTLADPTGELRKKWGVTSIPTTVLVDENMKVYRQFGGEVLLTSELAAYGLEVKKSATKKAAIEVG